MQVEFKFLVQDKISRISVRATFHQQLIASSVEVCMKTHRKKTSSGGVDRNNKHQFKIMQVTPIPTLTPTINNSSITNRT